MRSDDLRRRFQEAVARRDRPAAEAALSAMKAHLDQLEAKSDELATAEAMRGIAEVEEHLRLEALYASDPVRYWQTVTAILRAERLARLAIAVGDTDHPGDGVS